MLLLRLECMECLCGRLGLQQQQGPTGLRRGAAIVAQDGHSRGLFQFFYFYFFTVTTAIKPETSFKFSGETLHRIVLAGVYFKFRNTAVTVTVVGRSARCQVEKGLFHAAPQCETVLSSVLFKVQTVLGDGALQLGGRRQSGHGHKSRVTALQVLVCQ
jgi:hypothetical protein